jgi:hypothetical protein
MPISLPGVVIGGVAVTTSGEITLTTTSGQTFSAGVMPGFVRGWVDDSGRVIIEKESGEQMSLGNLSAPLAPMVATPNGVVTSPKIFTGAAFTDATGSVTFTFPTGFFKEILSAQATVERNTTDVTRAAFCWVSEWNMTRAIVRVAESKTSGVLLGGTVEGVELSGAGILIHATVIGT